MHENAKSEIKAISKTFLKDAMIGEFILIVEINFLQGILRKFYA